MPKLSLAKRDAVELGFGFGEGYGRIVDVKSVAHQIPASKKTGVQLSGPGLFLFVTIDRTDEAGKSFGDEPTTDEMKLGDLEYFRPGKLDDPDGDPKDLGDDLGTEGNSIYSTGERKMLKGKRGVSKAAAFLFSLEEAGFRSEVLARCYLPDLVGMLAHFTQVTHEGGTDKDGKKIDPYQSLVVDKILEFPYDKPAAGKTAAKAAAKPAASKGAGAPATPDPAVAAASANGIGGDPEDIAKAFLASMLEGWAGKTHDAAKLTARSFTYCGKMTPPAPPKIQSAVGKLLGDAAWVAEHGGPMGITVAGTAVTFPEAD